MKKIKDYIKLISGSPQFRIKETTDTTVPVYTYYGQPEVENDLINLNINKTDNRQVQTLDKVVIVQESDVLFSLISGKATWVRAIHQGYLITQNYVKLILPSSIDKKYFIYLLNEDISIKRQFQVGLQGSMVLKYTIKQLKELELPSMPILKTQKMIGELYFNQLHLQALRQRVATSETIMILEKIKGIKPR